MPKAKVLSLLPLSVPLDPRLIQILPQGLLPELSAWVEVGLIPSAHWPRSVSHIDRVAPYSRPA